MSLFTPLDPAPPSLEARLRAVQALIVHEGHRLASGAPEYAFTTHAIEHTAKGLEVGAGRLLSVDDQQRLLEILLGSLSGESGFLPPEVLSHSPAQLAWYVPGRLRPMWFREGTRTLRLRAPWPTLVFRVRQGHLSLAALAHARRPQAEDRLFHAPLMNVFDHTGLCPGTAALPHGWSLAHRAGYEKAVFETAFTHVNHEGTLRSTTKGPVTTGQHLRFWRELARSGHRAFPAKALAPLEHRLGQWLTGS